MDNRSPHDLALAALRASEAIAERGLAAPTSASGQERLTDLLQRCFDRITEGKSHGDLLSEEIYDAIADLRAAPQSAPQAGMVAGKIQARIAELDKWITLQPVNVKQDQAHLNEHSLERLYWHYGYMMGLKDALAAAPARAGEGK